MEMTKLYANKSYATTTFYGCVDCGVLRGGGNARAFFRHSLDWEFGMCRH
jgi:hypothetical protein